MHAKSWLFLVVSFLTGLTSAFIVAYYTFDAKPIEVRDPGPTVKILVTKKDIPRGAEVTAEAIAFEDAPIAELPEAALTSFQQVYRRRAAYPIPVGYPVCEDFLFSKSDSDASLNTYLPPGTQLVSLEVEQLRSGDSLSEIRIPISNYLAADQKIDIRAVPRGEPQGVYMQRRNQLLKEYGPKTESEENGELVLHDVVIHQIIAEEAANSESSRPVQKLTLILNGEEAEKLVAAAKKGKLRVVPRNDASNVETPEVLAAVEAETEAETEPAGKTDDDTMVLQAPTPRLGVVNDEENSVTAKGETEPEGRKEAVVSFVTPSIIYSHRSEKAGTETAIWSEEPVTPTLEFVEKEPETAMEEMPEPTAPAATPTLIVTRRDEEPGRRPSGYSPFDTRTRVSKTGEETENRDEESRPPRPLPLRSQVSGNAMFR